MRNKIIFLLVCIILASCGTHRKAVLPSGKGKHSLNEGKGKQAVEIEYDGLPWVSNVSKPYNITQGLQNRHLSVWASHGRYYNQSKGKWEWQRPNLFCTNEDLFTQTIVVPYLIPMLENAGANVFTPRERDWQKEEIIVDNDDAVKLPYYTETNIKQEWRDAGIKGFAQRRSSYNEGENPFKDGTTRMAKASDDERCEIVYMPQFNKGGEYAVYVSYPAHKKNVPDAHYTVYHKGQKTVFKVNQRMGGGTWVYLGTFDFDAGCSAANRVVLSNESDYKGVVTADAVRFGGGMGNIGGNGCTSEMARCIEGARYYAQWAGAPDSVYMAKDGADNYKEDIYARPYMTNWLAGGSCFMPNDEGLNVPIELALAVHSDAGVSNDYSSIIGTLTICTTNANGGLLASGQPRYKSKELASRLLNDVTNDISTLHSKWNKRELYDRNYAETRCPQMTSAIIETLSHQNFPDMAMAQDPNFRFTLARSIYKSILRHTAESHSKSYTITPLSPINIRTEFCANTDTLIIRWDAQTDMSEPTAKPKSYILYTSAGNNGFDNGIKINSTACKIKMQPDILYNFKVSAVNDGGESFPSEVVSAVFHYTTAKTIMVVNGFHRLSSPAIINNDSQQGFDLSSDPGVWQGKMAGLCGSQLCFDKTKLGIEGKGGLGYSGSELEGMILKGNEFNYTTEHAKAIMSAGKYNITSCSAYAVEKGKTALNKYDCIDLILGLEKNDGHSLYYYKSFSPAMQDLLTSYTRGGGNLIVSGAYVGSDMTSGSETVFLNNVLHVNFGGNTYPKYDNTIQGMSTSFNFYSTLNEEHYAATSIDVLNPVSPAFCALTYGNGNSVCVAYDGSDYRSFTMGFPFECITSTKKQSMIMKGILNFIFK